MMLICEQCHNELSLGTNYSNWFLEEISCRTCGLSWKVSSEDTSAYPVICAGPCGMDIAEWNQYCQKKWTGGDEPQIDVTPQDTIRILKTCRDGETIFYRGRTLYLCQTSLLDRVCTGNGMVEHLINHCRWGARIVKVQNSCDNKYLFAVITHLSDG